MHTPRPKIKKFIDKNANRLYGDHSLVTIEPVIVKRYMKTLANRGFYKKKPDTCFDTHCIKTDVRFWCRKWDSFSVIGRPCLHSMLRTPRLDPKIRGGKRQHCCLFFSALRVPLSEGTTKKAPSRGAFFVVPEVGLEPTRYRYQRILSPSRLPIPSFRRKSQV